MGWKLFCTLLTILLVLTITQKGSATCTCPNNGCFQSPSTGACEVTATSRQYYTSYYYLREYYNEYYYTSCGFWGWSRCSQSRRRSRQVRRQRTSSRTTYYCNFQCCSGYQQSGRSCNPVCNPSCANGGTCVAPYTCACQPEWRGPTCNQPVCNPSCANGGTCVALNTCACRPEWRGPTCDQRTVSPASGSLSGGTILSLYHSDVYDMYSVDKSSVAVDVGGIPCDVLSGLSTTSTRPLRCTTRAYPSAQEEHSSPPLAVTVALGSNEYQLTSDFTYSWSSTPQIHYLDPPAIPVGHMLGFTGVNLPEDPRDIEAVFIGEQPCDLIDTASNDPYGTYTKEHTNPFRWIRCLPRQVPPGVYNVSVVVNSGTDGKAWRHSNSKYYGPGGRLIMLEVFPDIHSVQPSASHPHGGELITITGVGLNCGAVVDIDGVPCKVIRSNFEEVKCVTGAAPEDHLAVSEDGIYSEIHEGYRFKGGRGVSSRVFENVGGNYIRELRADPDYPDNPNYYFIYPSYQPEGTRRYDRSGELLRAFFTPQETTTYQLWIQSDNEGQLFFGTSANINSVTMIARIFSWNAYTFGTKLVTRSYLLDATQRAAPMELVAGETYLLIAINKEDTGSDFIRVLALLPNSMYMKNESGWVIQDEPGWPNGYFMRPLPGFMLQTVEETPQVHLRVNGLLASCLGGEPLYYASPSPYNGCSFMYRHSRPHITRTCPNTWELSWNISILENVAIALYTITLEAVGRERRILNVAGNGEQIEGFTVTLTNVSMETEYTATITGITVNGEHVPDSVVFYTESCDEVTVAVDGYTHSSTLTCGDSVPLGTQLLLVCQVVGLPYGTPLSYTWTCPIGPCEVEGYYGRKVYNNHILVVNMTSTSDGGTYTCQVTTTGGQEATGNITLNVAGGLVVHSFGRLISFEFPITDLQQISGPDGIGRITCTDSSGPARFLTPSGSLNTGGVSQTTDGTTATLVVNPASVDNYENRDAYCNDFRLSYTYLFLSGRDPFSVPRLAVNTVTNSDVEYRAERSDTATERVITGYDVFRFGVPMIGVYGNAEIRRSFSISPVVPGAQYRIRAWAIGGVASSSNRRSEVPAVEYVTTGTAKSSVPRLLTITRMLEKKLELNWLPPTEPNGEVQYIIYYTPEGGTEQSIYTGSNLTYFNLTGLERNQLYINIAVQAVNSAGRSDRSVAITRYNHAPSDVNECAIDNGGCEQVCNNTVGSYYCSCHSGYRLDVDDHRCHDVNECSTGNGGCGHTCTNTIGSYYCSCDPGYRLGDEGRRCHDINECAEGTAECNQICVNTQGNYTCDCYHGYNLLTPYDHTCHDIDECTTGNGGCYHNCNNTVGSYHCYCRTGYTQDSDGRNCNDVDECAENTDGCEQICTDTDGSFQCSCRYGFRLGSDGRSCDDINECAEDDHVCAHNCHNSVGSHSCSCNAGYRLNPDGRNCDDINECAEGTAGCNQTCTNTPGNYTCACYHGYTLSTANRHICLDVDECSTGNGGCQHNCNNTVGSYHCYCRTGYTLDSDGRTCNDADECTENTDGCEQMCTDTDGSFECSCRAGFRLGSNRMSCDDIDECAEDDHVCAHNCHNSVGSHSCSCNAGYRLNPDGRNCDDINECAEGTAECNQICVNTQGNYTCDCHHGYDLLTPYDHTCLDVDECITGNGGCQHNCNNTVGSYHCYCRTGYTQDSNGHSCNDVDECAQNTDGCEQMCTDTAGSYQCSCRDGYRLGRDGRRCEDVNECFVDADGCAHNCHNTEGAHNCSCDEGYMLNPDGRNCNDIDECAMGTHLCNQICDNTPGNYTCACNHGYSLSTANQYTCHDIDECTTGNGGCQHNCENTVGSYHCYCRTGYTLDSDGRNCNDVNECTAHTDGCGQDCTNTVGSFMCSCGDGFRLGSDGRSCEDIDECAEDDHVCAHNCHNSVGSHSCSCNAGYRLNPDGRNCDDIDECVENSDGCEQMCTDTDSSFQCSCRNGFRLGSDMRSCDDIDECAENDHVCAHNCHNSVGSHSCSCNAGYRLNPDGRNCDDINECAEGTAGCNQACTNTHGNYTCACYHGYTLSTANHHICLDVDECSTGNGGCGHTCNNTIGSYYCSCDPGYRLGDNRRRCHNIDECAENSDGCEQMCTDTDGSFECSCGDGFRIGSEGRSCDDIDECAEDDHVCAHNCHNSVGSHSCSCNGGYRLNPDGRNCDDVNECVEGTAVCNQRCMNTPGNYTCGCYHGYTLHSDNRHICVDIDECTIGNGGCGHTCTNTIGSYYCSCDPGYRLGDEGRRCHDIDECTENTDGCEQICADTDGSFECSCRAGFHVGSDGRSCDDIDECATNNGGCEHMCSNTLGSFYCTCPSGYYLIWDARRCEEFIENATVGCPINPEWEMDVGDIRCNDSDCVISILLQLVGYFLDTDGDNIGDYTDDGDTFSTYFDPEKSICITDILKALLNGNQYNIVLPFNPIVSWYSFTRSTQVSICQLLPITEQEVVYPGILWLSDIAITVELVGITDPQIYQIRQQGTGHVGHIVFSEAVVNASAGRWYIEGMRAVGQSNLPLTNVIDIFSLQAVFSTPLDISAWNVDIENMFAVFDFSQLTVAINIRGTLHISLWHSVSVCMVSQLSLNPQDRRDNHFAIVTDCNSDKLETGSFSLGEVLYNVAQVNIGPVSQLNNWNLGHFRLFLTGASSFALDEDTAALLQFHISCTSVLAEAVGSSILVDLSFAPPHFSFDPSHAGHCNMGRPFFIQIMEEEDGRMAHFVPVEYLAVSYSTFRPHIISNITIDEFMNALGLEGLQEAHSTLLGGGALGLNNISTITYLVSEATIKVTSFISRTLILADGYVETHNLSLITQISFTNEEVGKMAFLTGKCKHLKLDFDVNIDLDLEEDAYRFKGYNPLSVNQRALLADLGLSFQNEIALKFIGLFDFELHQPFITITSDSGVENEVREGEVCIGGLLVPGPDNPFIGNANYSGCVTNGNVQSSTAGWEIAGSSLISLLEPYTGEVVHQIPFLNTRTRALVVFSDTTLPVSPLNGDLLSEVNIMQGTFVFVQMTYPTICKDMCQFVMLSQEEGFHFQLKIGISIDFGVSSEGRNFANKNSISSEELHELGAVVEVAMTFPLADFQFGAARASGAKYHCVVVSDFSSNSNSAVVEYSVAIPLTLHFDDPQFELLGQVELMFPEHQLVLQAAGDGCVRLSSTFSICNIHLVFTVPTDGDQLPGFVFSAQPILGSANCAAAGPLPYTAVVTINPTFVYVEIDEIFTVANLMEYFCVDTGKVSKVLREATFPQGLIFSHGANSVTVGYSNVDVDNGQLVRGTVDLFGVSAFTELHLNLPTSLTLVAVMDPISMSRGFIKMTASRSYRYHGPLFYGSYDASDALNPVVATNASGSVNILGQDIDAMLVVDDNHLRLALDAWVYQRVHVHIECEASYGTPQNAAFSVIGHVTDKSLGVTVDSIDQMYQQRSQYVTAVTKVALDRVSRATETYNDATADHSTLEEYTLAVTRKEREAYHELADVQYQIDQWCPVDSICDECVAHDKCAKISFYNLLVRNSPCCLRKQSTTCRMKAFECWIVQESIKTSIRMAAAVWHSAVIQRNLAETLLLASGTFKEEASERLQVATDALDTVLGAVSEDIGFVSRASKLLGDAVEGELSSVIDVKAIQWEVEMSLFKRLEFDVSITAGFTGQTLKTCTGHVVLHEPTSHMKAILCCLFDSFCEDTQKKRFKKLKLKPLVLAELYYHTGNPFGERVR